MPNDPGHPRLTKQISMLGVYALATGATLSAGLFLLPGPAAQVAGPALVLCYLIAAIPLVPAMFSVLELATAMPRAGGAYYFLDRSLGPLAGTVGGLGTWLALTLKTAFALVGMGAYVAVFLPHAAPWVVRAIAIGFAVLFGIVNWIGAKGTARFQMVLVTCLLLILVGFIGQGSVAVDFSHFEGFFDAGQNAILSTAGAVYISYVGITKIASVAEEVESPDKSLPRGVVLSLLTAVLIYGLCTFVMVGVLPMDELAGDLAPMAHAAEHIAGRPGMLIVSVAALMAFASVVNAGIMSASRYPLAMGRDHLLPRVFRRLSRRGTPSLGVLVTVLAILFFVVALDPLRLAKLASAFQLLMFALLCIAVIVMRESRIESYDPGFKSPLYPWMQILGIVAPFVLIAEMGWLPILFSCVMIAVGIAWFQWYANPKVDRHGAIYHVFERLGQRRFHDLDRELRTILKEKGLRAEDPFDEIVARASVIDCQEGSDFGTIVERASNRLAEHLPVTAEYLAEGFLEGTRTGATPVSRGVALPHLRVPGIEIPAMLMARCRGGVDLSADVVAMAPPNAGLTRALFFLVSPTEDPGQHLRLLAQLASRVDPPEFMDAWLEAADEHELKAMLLRHERSISILIERAGAAEEWVDEPIRGIDLPDGCLVAIVHRAGEAIIPRGGTVLREGDRVTIIGEEGPIGTLYGQFLRNLA